MEPFVIVVTKGRPREVAVLVDQLGRQTRPIRRIVVVGAGPEDLGDLDCHPACREGLLITTIAARAGLCIQRNCGIDLLVRRGDLDPDMADAFIVFFDDDYRPADDWLAEAERVYSGAPDVVGLTGRVLGDGINGPGLGEDDAAAFLDGTRVPQDHPYGGTAARPVTSAYGCNMAFRATVFRTLRFDERLPMYGWQEDRDFTGQARVLGRVVLAPDCRGVHLGAKGGRSPGRKLGYSQIANPAYLARKGTMEWRQAIRMALRNMAANHVRMLRPEPWVDRRGRTHGNWLAVADLLRGRASPDRAVDL